MRQYCSQVILENFFEPCVLFLLMQKESYGYELAQELNSRCSCSVNMGNLYRGLGRLQRQGHVKKRRVPSDKGPDKIMYNITPSGEKLLKEWINGLDHQMQALNLLITNYKNLYDRG